MKRLSTLLLITLTLFFVATSCSDKDDSIIEKGTLISATFNPTTKTFTLKYSEGASETIDAIIDNNDTPATASAKLEDGTILSVNNATVEGKATIGSLSEYKYVNDWIFEQMNLYYLWNSKIPKNPDFSMKPNKFFYSLLNSHDKTKNPQGDRFSWIEDSSEELLDNLSGVSSDDIGFDWTPVWTDKTQFYALVIKPKKGTDAYVKGIERGRFIIAIDDKDITSSNYRSLFFGTGSKKLSIADYVYNSEKERYDLTYTGDITIQMERRFAENPVYMDSVYTINDKKIGYLVYNFFYPDNRDGSNSYDRLLMNSLAKIKAKGATEMVLDLRYNGGGRVSSSLALASALVKDKSTENILITYEYNKLYHAFLKKELGDDFDKDFFIDKVIGTNIEIPNLNLNRLYVLVTGNSASASELIINGLKPYMEVVLVGETTYGKNVGSVSIYEDDNPKIKIGLQPIAFKYYNSKKESDFYDGFTPDFEIDEFNTIGDRRLVEFGNTEDPLLNKAIEEITGKLPTRSTMGRQIATYPKMTEVERPNSIFKDKARFELYDDIRGERINKLMKEEK